MFGSGLTAHMHLRLAVWQEYVRKLYALNESSDGGIAIDIWIGGKDKEWEDEGELG